jgi:hypothetical protein
MGSSFYYLSLAVFSLAMGIYNISVSSGASGLQCYKVSLMDGATFSQFNSSFGASGLPAKLYYLNPSDNSTIYVREAVSNTYSIIIMILSIVFFSMMSLSLLLAIIISSMSNMLPEDFMNIGRLKKWSAVFCKILPPLFTLLSWLVMILIIVIWVFIIMGSCVYSETGATGLFDPESFIKNVSTLNIVNSALWFFMHYIMSIYKEVTYQEPFMYSPDDPSHGFVRICLFKKLGP